MAEHEALISRVRRAQEGDLDAFAWLVRRFQDMAAGYAASILGDFHLAEDAAQEAFVEAWRDLPQLREPAAFTGWLRRIVFKRCDRLTRGKRLTIVPMEAAADLASPHADPAEEVERCEMQAAVRRAIQSLPELERQAIMLFYISEYSQPEIAAFLGVALVTVKKRLAAARRRLKERMIPLMQDDLHARRPSRDDAFAARVLAFTQGFFEKIDAGISLARSLAELGEKEDDERFRAAIEQINQEVQQGETLSHAMGQHPEFFDEHYVRAVRMGEVTGTLDLQLARLAAGERFDFEGHDDPAKFDARSPTIVRLAEALLDLAIERGATEFQILLERSGYQTHLVTLTHGVVQTCSRYDRGPWGRPRTNIPGPLFERFQALAGITKAGGARDGEIRFTSGDGRTFRMPVSVHPSYSGQTLVIRFLEDGSAAINQTSTSNPPSGT